MSEIHKCLNCKNYQIPWCKRHYMTEYMLRKNIHPPCRNFEQKEKLEAKGNNSNEKI